MVKNSLKKAHPELLAAQAEVDAARMRFDSVKERIQQECEHPIIAHSYYDKMRICLHCRLEEHSNSLSTTYWRSNTGETNLNNDPDRLIVEVDSSWEICRLRNINYTLQS